jgi:hypothetical protein
MMTKTYDIELVIGGSYPGNLYGVWIKSNLPKTKLEKACKDAFKVHGIDKTGLQKEILAVRNDVALLLNKLGFSCEFQTVGCDFSYLSKENYVYLWLFLCKLGNPDFEYEVHQKPKTRMDIGGWFFY